MKRIILAMACIVALTSVSHVLAANPRILNYQALLTLSGSPVVTPVEVTFRIYDDSTGGSVMWSDTRMVTPDADGRISELLGTNTSMDESVFAGDNRYLSIQVTGDAEMAPRQRLAASPYSFKVGTIDGAKGGKVTGSIDVGSSALATASATEAQITVVGLGGDSLVLGPASQAALRAVNSAGEELAAITMDPVEGGKFSVRVDGTSQAVHSATSSTYYTSAAAQKGPNALAKLAEIGASGVVVYNPATGDVLAKVDPSTGQVATTSLNVGPSPGVAANKSTAACGDGNSSDLGPVGSNNNAVGPDNDLSGATSSFSVGECNVLTSSGGTALGARNQLHEADAFAMGADNYIGSPRSVAFGNQNGVYGGGDNFVFGDNSSMSSGGDGVIGGGFGDTASYASVPVIAGGKWNKIVGTSAANNSNFYSVIGGGYKNAIDVSTDVFPDPGRSVIAGGQENTITRNLGTIGGGQQNTVSGYRSTISGGAGNTASGDGAFIGGGESHTASGIGSVVAGGGTPATFADRNQATADHATVSGGRKNIASGESATVPGGELNTAGGSHALAAGRRAKANNDGAFVWADNTDADFASTADNQFLIRAGGNVGINTNNPSQPLEVAGTVYSSSGGFKFPDGSVQSSAASSITDGWTDDGSVVRLSGSSDSVGIGTTTPTEKLDVDGNIHASGMITSGNSIHIDGINELITTSSGNLGFGSTNMDFDGLFTCGTVPHKIFKIDPGLGTADFEGDFTCGSTGTPKFKLRPDLGIAEFEGDFICGGPLPRPQFRVRPDSGGVDFDMDFTCGTVPHPRFRIRPSLGRADFDGDMIFSDFNGTERMKYDRTNGNLSFFNFGGNQTVKIETGAGSSSSGSIGLYAPFGPIPEIVIGPGGIVIGDPSAPYSITSGGGFNVYSDSDLTSGVTLAPGGGAWASVSDRNVKDNIRPVNSNEILAKINELEISRWNYDSQDQSIQHIGPMAQDFYRLFGVGDNDRTITTVDPDGVALAAIKALNAKTNELEAKSAELDQLKARIAQLEQLVAKLGENRHEQ